MLSLYNFLLFKDKKRQVAILTTCPYYLSVRNKIKLGMLLLILVRFVFYEIQHLLM